MSLIRLYDPNTNTLKELQGAGELDRLAVSGDGNLFMAALSGQLGLYDACVYRKPKHERIGDEVRPG